MKDIMMELTLLYDAIRRTEDDLVTIQKAMLQNDAVALGAILRYYRHVRDFTGMSAPNDLKKLFSAKICDILEAWIDEYRAKEGNRNEKETSDTV